MAGTAPSGSWHPPTREIPRSVLRLMHKQTIAQTFDGLKLFPAGGGKAMMQQNFCSVCGAPLRAADKFCPNCGTEIRNTGNDPQRDDPSPPNPAKPNTAGAFPRMLAYIPGLFWVPLAADSQDKNNRECANQGLLLLLYCMLLPVLFSIAGAVLGAVLACMGIPSAADAAALMSSATPYSYANPYPYSGFQRFGTFFGNLGRLFQPFGGAAASNAVMGLLTALPFALLALYVPVNSLWGFIHCINHRGPHVLPIIGKIKIIK